MEPRDPSIKEQLAAKIWQRFKTDKRYPYLKLGLKLFNDGCTNQGQIVDALAYLSTQQDVRSPWAVVMSAPVLARALTKDTEARAVESSRVDKEPQRLGDVLGGILRNIQDSAANRANRNDNSHDDSVTPTS